MTYYKTFLRSTPVDGNFLRARKITQETGITQTQAITACERYNSNRNKRQIAKGTMMEYTSNY